MCTEKRLSLQLQVVDKPANPDADVKATCADSCDISISAAAYFSILVRATCDAAQNLQQEPENLYLMALGVCMSCAIHA